MGLGLVYGGLEMTADQEVLTSEQDFYSTHEALRLRADGTASAYEGAPLYDEPATASVDQNVTRLCESIAPATRAIALPWGHSGTGVKLPISESSAESASRASIGIQQPLLCVDGVRGFEVKDSEIFDLPAKLRERAGLVASITPTACPTSAWARAS